MEHLFKEKVNYDSLIGKEQEVYNFAKTASVLVDYGFSCNLITADKHGADMIAYHIDTGETMSIQLKGSRAVINKKYKGRNLWIAYTDRKTNEILPTKKGISLSEYQFEDVISLLSKDREKISNWFQEKIDENEVVDSLVKQSEVRRKIAEEVREFKTKWYKEG